jgi:hypothetical protein
MAVYLNPLSLPNAFLQSPPVVLVVRHVRVTAASETIAEDANALVRYLRRIDGHRAYPQPLVRGPQQRNIPDNSTAKKPY